MARRESRTLRCGVDVAGTGALLKFDFCMLKVYEMLGLDHGPGCTSVGDAIVRRSRQANGLSKSPPQDHMFSRFICWARCRIVQIKIVKTGSHKSSFEQNSNNSGNARRGRAWKGAVSTGRGAVVIVDTP